MSDRVIVSHCKIDIAVVYFTNLSRLWCHILWHHGFCMPVEISNLAPVIWT